MHEESGTVKSCRYDGYEAVVGLEIHAELRTGTKIFCSCPTAFGAEPNTHCCPVCTGAPGTLPVLNRRAVELAVTAGLALNCEIADVCRMDRKQYFYPDLPKAYQISQNEYPVCRNGSLTFRTSAESRTVRITRIHIEEDAGKLMYDGAVTRLDDNRCGVPLIEIVTSPDLHSGEEAAAFLRELRSVLIACGVSDCKMQEGSLRCDVNVSVHAEGQERLGERTEIKNLNSFSFVEKAVDAEAKRQIALLKNRESVRRCTLRFVPERGETIPMRGKENAQDYRFFPEPDLPPFCISRAMVERLKKSLPELPAETRKRLCETYGIKPEDAVVLTGIPGLSGYFDQVMRTCRYPLVAVGILLTDLLRLCRQEPFDSPVQPERLAELADLAGDRRINSTVVKKILFRIAEQDESPRAMAEREQLTQINDVDTVAGWVIEVLAGESKTVADYRGGKSNALRALQGKLMAKSGGRADPLLAERLLLEQLQSE